MPQSCLCGREAEGYDQGPTQTYLAGSRPRPRAAQVVALGGEEGAQSVFISVYSIANCLGRLASGHGPFPKGLEHSGQCLWPLLAATPPHMALLGVLHSSSSGQAVTGRAWPRERVCLQIHAR